MSKRWFLQGPIHLTVTVQRLIIREFLISLNRFRPNELLQVAVGLLCNHISRSFSLLMSGGNLEREGGSLIC